MVEWRGPVTRRESAANPRILIGGMFLALMLLAQIFRIADSFERSRDEGEAALFGLLLTIAVVIILILGMQLSFFFAERHRIHYVEQAGGSGARIARAAGTFSIVMRDLGLVWKLYESFYVVSVGESGVTLWRGVRNPKPFLTIAPDEIRDTRIVRAGDVTGLYWAVELEFERTALHRIPLTPDGTMWFQNGEKNAHSLEELIRTTVMGESIREPADES